MKSLLRRIWLDDEGVLTFEWILLITVLVIGIVGGISTARDALISEFGDISNVTVKLDQSYVVVSDPCTGTGTTFSYVDEVPECMTRSGRPEGSPVSQGEVKRSNDN